MRIRRRQTALPTLPYWRSILVSFVLVLSMMFLFEGLADPQSGELWASWVVTPVVFALFAALDAGVFYAEFRLRKRRPSAGFRTEENVGDGAHVR